MYLSAYRRFALVVYHLLPLLVAYARDRRRYLLFGRSRSVPATTRRRRAQVLLQSFVTLGPTYVKLGQLLSTRPDVLPPEYVDVLEALQDDVPPASWAETRDVLEAELGPVETVFDDFDTRAISGASLGQVYVARRDGRRVAVKVRRPGVEALVEADLRVVRWWLPVLVRFVDDARAFSLETLADEFEETIREEMDYERERAMLEEIGSNLADREGVRVPDAVPELSTDRVLTMEYVGGTKISDLEDLDALEVDRTALAERLQRTYLEMIVEDGVFHADPHPGNLAVREDGTVVFYDFGMSDRVGAYVQDRIVDFYAAIARRDTDAILDALVEMGTLSPEADRDVMADVMELAIADARGEDIEQYRVRRIVQQVEDTLYEFPLRLPPDLALVLRVATVVEGVCVTLDPEFDFIAVATDFLRERGYLEAGARDYLEDRAEAVGAFGESVLAVPPKLERTLDAVHRDDLTVTVDLADDERALDRLAGRLVLGAVLSAALVSGAILHAAGATDAVAVPGVVALLATLLLWRSFRRRRRGIRARPQFTRHRMRQRRRED